MVIAISDTLGSEHKFKSYLEWLNPPISMSGNRGGEQVNAVTISYRRDNLNAVRTCDALLLTGGHDVNPASYHGPVHHPKIIDVDRNRDDFERKALDEALREEIPVLGICRGLQLVNVHFGGTLMPDLGDAGYQSHRSATDAVECRHAISVEDESMMHQMTGMKTGEVNSSHHQAILMPGKGLRIAAHSADGIIEAIELEDAGERPFFLMVQWHPERMNDVENPFSKDILKKFLMAAQLVKH